MDTQRTRPEPTPTEWTGMLNAATAVANRLATGTDRAEVQSHLGLVVAERVESGTWATITNQQSWARGVAVHHCADLHCARLRREEAWTKLSQLRPAGGSAYPPPDVALDPFWRIAVRELTYAQSRVLYLTFIGFVDSEVAEYLGIHRGTVASHLHDARLRLSRLDRKLLLGLD